MADLDGAHRLGHSNMRTGARRHRPALALIGAKPVWDPASRRVTGYEIISMAKMKRPRVDVTLRISGFFRDAFPDQIALFDRAARAVAALDETRATIRWRPGARTETATLIADGVRPKRRRGRRRPGVAPSRGYGRGLQALMDEGGWIRLRRPGRSFSVLGVMPMAAGEEGPPPPPGVAPRPAPPPWELFEQRLATVEPWCRTRTTANTICLIPMITTSSKAA